MNAPSTQISRVKQRIEDLGLSGSVFARVCGITPSAFSQAQRGIIQLSGPVEKTLADASVRLTEISAAIRPLSLPEAAHDLKMILDYVAQHPDAIEALGAAVSGIFNNGSGNDVGSSSSS